MPSRRFHQKLRHGCANCRQRHIRCEEERPACRNCTRLGGRCSFLDVDQDETTVSQPVQDGLSAIQHASYTDEAVWNKPVVQDSDLINHYSTCTALTLTDKAELLPTWQFSIPEHALNHPFLSCGLQAVAAMHIRQTTTPSLQLFYTELASQKQAMALALYISELQSIIEANCNGLFAFSSILGSLCYSFLQAVDNNLPKEEYVDRVVNIFDYLLGTKVVAHTGRVWIRQGNLLPMMTPRKLGNVLLELQVEYQKTLEGLLHQIEEFSLVAEGRDQDASSLRASQPQGGGHIDIYRNSIEMLSNSFPKKDGSKPDLSAVIGWPVFVEKEFVRLLRQSDCIALVILAYYGSGLHGFNDYWWLQGVGARLVQAVSQILGPEYDSFLQWPLVKTSAEVEIADAS